MKLEKIDEAGRPFIAPEIRRVITAVMCSKIVERVGKGNRILSSGFFGEPCADLG